MICPRPGCEQYVFERRILDHGHEIVEHFCPAGHSAFVSARQLKQTERPLDHEMLDEIERRREILGTFSCGHTKTWENKLKHKKAYVCRLCNTPRARREAQLADVEQEA